MVPLFAFMGLYVMLFIALAAGGLLDFDGPEGSEGSSDADLEKGIRVKVDAFFQLVGAFFTFDIPGAPALIRVPFSLLIIGSSLIIFIWAAHKVMVALGALIPFT